MLKEKRDVWASAIAALVVAGFVATGLVWVSIDKLNSGALANQDQGPAHAFLYLLIGGGR